MFFLCFRALSTQQVPGGYVHATNLYYYYYYYDRGNINVATTYLHTRSENVLIIGVAIKSFPDNLCYRQSAYILKYFIQQIFCNGNDQIKR